MSKVKRIKRATSFLRIPSMKELKEYQEHDTKESYETYDAIQTVLEEICKDHLRPYYPPVKREEIVFTRKASNPAYLLQKGFREMEDVYSLFIPLFQGIEVWIQIPKEGIEKIQGKDPYDAILVLDESFGQPYGPFYIHYHDKVSEWPFLQKIIALYNQKLLGLGIFRKRKEKNICEENSVPPSM